MIKEELIRVFFMLFPRGNYRYYAMYIPGIIVLGIAVGTFPIFMELLIHGITIGTDTFVYSEPMATNFNNPGVESSISTLLTYAGDMYLLFVGYVVVALFIDVICRPLYWGYGVSKLAYKILMNRYF